VGVAWSGTDGEFEAFVDEHDLTFPQLSDAHGDVFAYYDITMQPAIVTIDAAGETATRFGSVEPDEIDDLVQDVVGSA
jgi:peroxiredoxin